ncbi:hypothetical protein KY284_010975 [Solanum tuberosum]|nr:hypothetical protein KY284_010975 [Solanum tuberosum]
MRKTVSQGDRLGDEVGRDFTLMQPDSEANNMEQLKGDARDFLNDKRAAQKDIEKPRQHQMDVSGGYNNQQGVAIGDIVDHVQEHNSDSGQQLNGNDVGDQSVTDARLNIEITATSKPIDLQAENSNREENASGNWTVIAHKNSVGSRIGSSTSRSNSSSQEKGAIECVDPNLTLPTQNVFETLSATRKIQLEHCMEKGMSSLSHAKMTNDLIISKEKQGQISVSRWADFVDEEEQVSPPPLNSKLSPEAPIFVPKSVIAKKNESGASASGIS